MSFRRVVGLIGLALTVVAVAFITLASAEAGSFHGPLARLVRESLVNVSPRLELSKAQFGFAANIGMFVPLGFFLGLALPRRKLALSLAALPMASAVIESIQFFLPTRGTQFEDVLANSVGGWIGTGLAWIVVALATRGQSTAMGQPTTRGRSAARGQRSGPPRSSRQ